MFENFFYYFNFRTILLIVVVIYHLTAGKETSLLSDMGVGQSSSSYEYSTTRPVMKQRTWNEIIKFRGSLNR